ncbi:phytanoyl-CoA dioxygenase family protein [Allokutzneria albata]|uniref:Ectoine hydroxylase-related dioxygenase, phytanoyl-CoA dioxygenase (PhyH) family n=1 Tax=Allokutzneria albata TaxID=211114 RepID=A0A1G9V7K2_ALLAB|nr:phytanoyl-CoA dioxygenase family protein [Allokutzneria albata]SDM67855.1 Ectoine hydroxylase-related dioxygenase, phytanoyl-CoA dioxygenase (PhyH) family [Allokutzneria albata]
MTYTAQVLSYEDEGYAVFRDVLDPSLMAEVRSHVEWLHREHPGRRGEQLSHELVAADPFWIRLVSDDRLLDIASAFLGDDLALFASHYISKPPYSGQPVLWHQDGAFWPLDPMRVITLWLAVDESTPENGCLRVIPGSHRMDLGATRERADVDNVLGAETTLDVDESQAVDLLLRPGDVEVHHPHIVHGSNANTSPKRRCGLTIRYIPTSTRITSEEQPFPSAVHLRGELGVNVYQSRPVVPARWAWEGGA